MYTRVKYLTVSGPTGDDTGADREFKINEVIKNTENQEGKHAIGLSVTQKTNRDLSDSLILYILFDAQPFGGA